MNCRRIEELIPLYVESDLNRGLSQAVSQHLASCEACGRLITEYRDSQQWMCAQATPEFDDDFFDDMRRSVLRSIEEKPQVNWIHRIAERLRLRPVMVATAALLILIGGLALYTYLSNQEVRSINENGFAQDQQEKMEDQTAPDQDKKNAPENRRPRLPRRHDRKAAVAKEPRVTETLPDREPGMISESIAIESIENVDVEKLNEGKTRIEIQTKDPNIRIIWFAPKPDDSRSTKPATE